MNFASWSFVLAFMPAFLLVFAALRGPLATLRPWLLIFGSGAFYAAAGWANALVMALSLLANFVLGRSLVATGARSGVRRALLALGVAINLALLFGFKIAAVREGAGHGFRDAQSILIPLAISYVTFQQIGFLVSCFRDPKPVTAKSYLFFIVFFPHLVLGPILRYSDMALQLRERRAERATAADLGVGLAIFVFGLAQKALLADQLAPMVDAVFLRGQTTAVSPLEAWAAAIGFQLQIYFDFAGYADMAIGLGRMVGVRMPINFDRPLFAVDRFDLWRRWHITFVVFMRTHVFTPLVRHLGLSAPLALAATGVISGLWHGLGWPFVLWGLIQAALMLALHLWRTRTGRLAPETGPARVAAVSFTFLTSAVLGVLFRSPTLEAAGHLYGALALSGAEGQGMLLGWRALVFLLLAAVVAWGLPNSRQLFADVWNAIDPRPGRPAPVPAGGLLATWRFSLSLRWAAIMALLLTLSLIALSEPRRFIYAQF